ncbi:Hypothetical protein R9X50_00156900 [Acrodontium crateriforme]|uniref:P-loop containing nucleoside triphosphate hydrolase protein n=1 Tax=Acrodontium crateriforme TaxID=150365 RepID=A0AAQ3LZA5_9PEZI|nr:Hypothetical protein R9X50_00156900 [Acrodontium crateriforme]
MDTAFLHLNGPPIKLLPTRRRRYQRVNRKPTAMRYLGLFFPILVAAITIFIANSFEVPAPSLRSKVFIIGLSKTGTTSIGDALDLLGYKRLGWKNVRSRQLVHTWANGDHDGLISQTRYYDALEDLPWPLMYQQMASLYPDAKFLLSLRKDEQTWLRSMRTHVSRGPWLPYKYFYGAEEVDGNEEIVLQSYRNHTANVRAFFRDQPHRYAELVIDSSSEANWDALCQIAECPGGRGPGVDFPRSNQAADWSRGPVSNFVQRWTSWVIATVERTSADCYYGSERSVILKPILEQIWKLISLIDQAFIEMSYQMTKTLSNPRAASQHRVKQ